MKRIALTLSSIVLLLAGASTVAQAQGRPGGPPNNSFQVRLGGFFPEGGGDLWDENEDVFTLDVSDFDDFVLGLSLVYGVNNYFEVGFNSDFTDGETFSSYRNFVDAGGFPIFHDTSLETIPLTLDARLLPFGRYRQRPGGRAVLKPVVYVGGGVGVTLWEYEEVGDFIDFSDPGLPVFFDRFKDDGAAFELHALAGVELPLNPRFSVLLEGRYSWADDELGGDFGGLGKIELGGASVFAGGSWRF